MDIIFDIPEPVFKKFDVAGKKKKKLFGRWGEVRVINSTVFGDDVTVIRQSGFERAYKETSKRKA